MFQKWINESACQDNLPTQSFFSHLKIPYFVSVCHGIAIQLLNFVLSHVTLLFGLMNHSVKDDSILKGQIKEKICSKSKKSAISCLSQYYLEYSHCRLWSYFVCQYNSFRHLNLGIKYFLFLVSMTQQNLFATLLLRVVSIKNSNIHCFKIIHEPHLQGNSSNLLWPFLISPVLYELILIKCF